VLLKSAVFSLVPIKFVTVTEKFSSLLRAAASSLSASNWLGAPFTSYEIALST